MPRRRKLVDKRPEVLNVWWNGDYLHIVERDPDNSIRVRQERCPYVCFIPLENVPEPLSRALDNDRRVHSVAVDGDFLRVQWRERNVCFQMCEALRDKGIDTCEGDVNPIRRWMTDNRPRLGKHRIGYLDLETDSRVKFSEKEQMRILCWTVVGADGTKKVGVLEEDTDEAEAKLLSRLLAVLQDFDLIAAWNGDRFDFPVLFARIARCRLPFQASRWLWLDQMDLFIRMNMMAAESGEEKQSYALQAIATALLGEGKDDFDASKTWEAWAAGGDQRRRMVRYCVKDTDLLRRIEDKTGYIGLLQTLAETCNVFPDTRGANPTVQAEGFLLQLAADRGYRFPTSLRRRQGTERYKGAYVMQPQVSGIVKNVHVGDFASLYPSIIVTWNMSPETIAKGEEHEQLVEANAQGAAPVEDSYSYSPLTDEFFSTEREGILPIAVKEVMRLRKHWNDLKASLPPGTDGWVNANRKATAYKIAANSFYGVIGSPMSRFFNRELAESITQCGAWLIKETIRKAVARGMVSVYGDTDSVFVAGANRLEFEEFVAWCNEDFYPDALRALGCKENLIKLAYEKEFERIIFSTAKKYCGRYVHFKGSMATEDSKPEVKGLEYKRGDAIRICRQMQSEVVDLLVGMVNGGHEDPDTFVEVLTKWQKRVLAEPIDLDDIVISKRLNKDLGGYVQRIKKDGTPARQLPHIEVAKILSARGQDMGEGAKVPYFIFDAGHPEGAQYKPAEDWSGHCDRWEVWDKMTYPPTMRLLEAAFPEFDWKPWAKTRPPKPRKPRTRKAKPQEAQA